MKEKFTKLLQDSKTLLPHLYIVIGFIVITALYFLPVLEGKGLMQGDDINANGMAQEIKNYEESHNGDYTAWTNSMFSGMPSYQIKGAKSFNIHYYLYKFLQLGLPYHTMAIFFMYLIGFYILLKSLKFKNLIAAIGAICFALSSYNVIIIAAGHITKCYAIACMPMVIAGLMMLFDRKYLYGGLLFTFALGIEIACNHPQILYYLAIFCALYVIYRLISDKIQKELKGFGKAVIVAAIGCVFAVLPNITMLWTTWEYGKFSTRSQSELSKKQVSSGLDINYATAWSYGIGETFTLMVPNFKGGESGQLGADKDAMAKVTNSQMAQTVASMNHYWGDQPFTSGPVYVGAIICFLFVLGLFIVKSSVKWWLLASTIVSILFSWGHNAGWFTDFIFNYLPLYNKFRSVSMALVIAQVSMPLLALLAVKEIMDNPQIIKQNAKQFYAALGISAGLCLLFVILPNVFNNFISIDEANNINQAIAEQPEYASQYQILKDEIVNARQEIFTSDVWRSFLFIIVSGVVVFLFSSNIIKQKAFVLAMGVVLVADLWPVAYRYLGPSDFQDQKNIENVFKPSTADSFILKDTDPNYRVLNLSQSVFNDGITPYFHKSIGGYHGAKMRRYQEFIDTILAPQINVAYYALRNEPEKALNAITNLTALNMLNTKFIITNPNSMPIVNMNTFGNAWFVKKYDLVENADQEIASLKRANPKETAVINKNINEKFMASLPKEQIFAEDSSIIALTKYEPNYLSYDAICFQDRLAVFSEIYYPKGWTAYIDGKEVEHTCADYILRAITIPQGQHKIEFKFQPSSVTASKVIAAISSILLILALLALVYKNWLKKQE